MQIEWKHIFALPDLFQQFRFKIFSEANFFFFFFLHLTLNFISILSQINIPFI